MINYSKTDICLVFLTLILITSAAETTNVTTAINVDGSNQQHMDAEIGLKRINKYGKNSKYLQFIKQNYEVFFKGYKLLAQELADLNGRTVQGRTAEADSIFVSSQPENPDIDEILEGVTTVGCDDANVGMIGIYGANAFPILAGETRWSGVAAVAAAANVEKGRVVLFGHEAFTKMLKDHSDNTKLFLNSINWASRHSKDTKKRAGVLKARKSRKWAKDIVAFLNENGYDSETISHDYLLNEATLEAEKDILIIPCFYDVQPDAFESILAYVKKGGAVVTGESYMEDDFQGNEMLRHTGMIYFPMNSDKVSVSDLPKKRFSASKELLKDTHSKFIAENIANCLESSKIIDDSEFKHMSKMLTFTLRYANKSDLDWLEKLKGSFKSFKPNIMSKDSPLKPTNIDRFHFNLQLILNELLEPDEMLAHPSAKIFPGEPEESTLPERKKTNKVTIKLPNNSEDPKYKWDSGAYGYSTGFYVPAGSKISLKIPGDIEFKFKVKIGCHHDDLTHKDEWLRFPIITMYETFEGNSADLASSFGGLIYIEDIEALKTEVFITNFTFELTGVIPTASFFLDTTSMIDWRESIQNIKAPWADFVSHRVILTIPGELARTIDDPETLMILWNNIIDRMSDIVNIPRNKNFHHIAFDVDIGKGYMHSGYPVMGYIGSSSENIVNATTICSTDGYIFYHEVGHNYQYFYSRSWTQETEREVTNNILAMYILNVVCGLPLELSGRYNNLRIPDMKESVQSYIGNGTNYNQRFKKDKDKDLGLIFYYQIVKLFGWGTYKRMFKAYSLLPEYPRNEDDKMDTKLIIYSNAAKRNLAGLFKSWGFPFSEKAAAQVAHLPESGFVISDLLK